MPLSEVSKLAIELCNRLGIHYQYGAGYARLRGVPMNELPYAPPFAENYLVKYHISQDKEFNFKVKYEPNSTPPHSFVSVVSEDAYTAETSKTAYVAA